MARTTRPATAAEAINARDEVQRRIAALSPEVARLRTVQRELGQAYKQAHRAWVTADIDLKHYKDYLYSLAAGMANDTLVMHVAEEPNVVRQLDADEEAEALQRFEPFGQT